MNRTIPTCYACRRHVLDTFAALAGVTLQPLPQLKNTRSSIFHTRQATQRSLSTSRRLYEPQDANSKQTHHHVQEGDKAAPFQNASVPWYLQVQTPNAPAPTPRLHALEDIPPVPSDAPPILHPILSHLSTQIGLDNLTLLDLRDVHPPPALGSNLLMILGTARSYKHLNTSADRFCRWLRSTYKLAPYADGLLGRNELKLKLRRKTRRMKLAQSVGNTVAMGATEGSDDGITTGWVCVNVGAVDGVVVREGIEYTADEEVVSRKEQEEIGLDEEEYENPADNSTVVGFGIRDTRQRVVVQMFLEDKRLEMDLEGLWDMRVQRRERKEEKLDKELGIES